MFRFLFKILFYPIVFLSPLLMNLLNIIKNRHYKLI